MISITMTTEVVYINLQHSDRRRAQIEKELKREEIAAERFNAIDGKKVDIISYKKKRWLTDPRWGTIPKTRHVGRLGIHLSHITVLTQFYKHNNTDDYLLVLEDDIRLAYNFKELLQEAIRLAPRDWEILFLSSAHKIYGQKISPHYVKPYPGHWRFTNHGMFCYLVRRQCITRLLKILLPISYKLMHIDHVIREHYGTGINAYYLTNRIAKHRDEISSERERTNNLFRKK